jgi:hypothetical protein
MTEKKAMKGSRQIMKGFLFGSIDGEGIRERG